MSHFAQHMRRFTDEEKRRIAHSAELSQLNRRLEEKNNSLIQEKEELVSLESHCLSLSV